VKKADLVAIVADKKKVTADTAKDYVDTILEVIKEMASKGEPLEIDDVIVDMEWRLGFRVR
jgi:nucleoid DNA-binding protein